MRFVLTSCGFAPTDGAIVPELIKHGVDGATNAILDGISRVLLDWVHAGGQWLAVNGIPIVAEGLLVWGMICFLMAITGRGSWLEKGAKSMLFSLLLGMVRYAV